MYVVDWVILVLLLIFAASGFRRGVVWEFFTLIGLVLGLVLTFLLRADLMNLIERFFPAGWERQWGGSLLFLLFFLIVYLAFTAIGRRLHDKIVRTPFKWFDRALGLALGILKGAVLIGLLVVVAEWFDQTGRVRNYFWKSEFIRWGRYTVNQVIYWEPADKRKWV